MNINELSQESIDNINILVKYNIKYTIDAGSIPINVFRLDNDKVAILETINPNFCFKNKFKIYINDELKHAPYGIYTWILLKINDKLYMIATLIYNHLEFCAKHSYLVYRFHNLINNINSYNIYDINILLSGEMDIRSIGVLYNFMSGTYMTYIDMNEYVLSKIDIVMYEILKKCSLNILDVNHDNETFIIKNDKDDIIEFLNEMNEDISFKIYKKEIYIEMVNVNNKIIKNETEIKELEQLINNFFNYVKKYEKDKINNSSIDLFLSNIEKAKINLENKYLELIELQKIMNELKKQNIS